MPLSERWRAALEAVAERWTDPEHPPRAEATDATFEADNRFTEEGIAFATNHAMDLLATGRVGEWLGERVAEEPQSVGVLHTGRAPLGGLWEIVVAALLGHEVWAHPAAVSPALLAAFFDEVNQAAGEERVRFVEQRDVFDAADAVIGTGTESERASWSRLADESGVPPEQRRLQPVRFGVAVLSGEESAAERSGLAEDVLLHEGAAAESIRIVWAPEDLDPDPLLDTLAGFREEFPAHPETDGSLAMPAAFLKAARQSHALGPGFLVSKGDPEPQDGPHLRWTPYAAFGEVTRWMEEHADELEFIATSEALAEALRPSGVPVIGFGDAHRPEPGRSPLEPALADFLMDLS